jgi:anti-sigma B factor antagonist
VTEAPSGPGGWHETDFAAAVEDGTSGEAIVRLRGDIDVNIASRLSKYLGDLARGRSVVIDLRGVRFIDSSGMGVLMQARNTAMANDRDLTLRNPSANVAKTLALAGFDKVFRIDG